MRIRYLKVEHRPSFEAEHWTARLQRLDLRIQHVLGPVDPLEGLP
jgi:hypothetical protein